VERAGGEGGAEHLHPGERAPRRSLPHHHLPRPRPHPRRHLPPRPRRRSHLLHSAQQRPPLASSAPPATACFVCSALAGPSLEGKGERGGRSRWGSGRSYVFQLPPAPTAPESAFCGRSRAEAVFLARLVALRQKQLLSGWRSANKRTRRHQGKKATPRKISLLSAPRLRLRPFS
jgi:hypothetical protein